MTREEAKREILFAKREVMADSWIDKAYDVAIEALEQPERKKGKWLHVDTVVEENCEYPYGWMPWYCSECGAGVGKHQTAFCPNCGADMRGEQE